MKTKVSRSGKATIAVVFTILVIVGAVSYWFTSYRAEQPPLASAFRADVSVVGGNTDAALAETNDQTYNTGNLRHVWTIVSKDSIPLGKLPQYQETFHDAELVQLNPDIWSWNEGERVTFSLPRVDATVEFLIERAEPGIAGSRSYIGSHHDELEIYPIVVTVGLKSTFAYIGSSKGSFEMVGNREFGWLMPTEAMERHVDYDKPDYVVPGAEHQHLR